MGFGGGWEFRRLGREWGEGKVGANVHMMVMVMRGGTGRDGNNGVEKDDENVCCSGVGGVMIPKMVMMTKTKTMKSSIVLSVYKSVHGFHKHH